jgi:flagellar basal body rod protein FlgG
MAIDCEGYFQEQKPNVDTAYTLDVSNHFSDQGVLVTSGGYALERTI